MSTMYSVGQMNQLGDALEAAKYSPEDVTKLRSSIDLLMQFRNVLNGAARIVAVENIIDLDADPFVPKNWEVEEHIKAGRFEWDPAKVALYLSENQQNGKIIKGYQLRKELKGKLVFNANLLDYLLVQPKLIPESWKEKAVFFWGTIYRAPHGSLCVRCLCWGGSGWYWDFGWLGDGFIDDNPAVVPASS